jgi:hypothetical protein
MVRRADEEPLEQKTGVEWVFGGKRECGGSGMRGVCIGDRDAGVDLFAFDTLRMHGIAADVRLCSEDGRDGVELDDG